LFCLTRHQRPIHPYLPVFPILKSLCSVKLIRFPEQRGLLEPIVRARILPNLGESAAYPLPGGFVGAAAVRIGMDGSR
jgi:hypothetical protein